jgi:FkbM family methyltransferase
VSETNTTASEPKKPHWPKRATQWAFRKIGYEIHPVEFGGPIEHEDFRRARLLAHRGITLVLDVGANKGQFARRLRRVGYEGRIESFEPLSDAFNALHKKTEYDGAWEARRVALGEEEGSVTINVSGNSYSSSLLPMKDRHLRADPDSRYVGTEEVPMTRLDTIWPEIVRDDDRVYLKLDVQGFELTVLGGADEALKHTEVVQTELSLVPLYENAPDYKEVISYLEARGFVLAGLEPGHEEPGTGEVVQADGVFVRPRS